MTEGNRISSIIQKWIKLNEGDDGFVSITRRRPLHRFIAPRLPIAASNGLREPPSPEAVSAERAVGEMGEEPSRPSS